MSKARVLYHGAAALVLLTASAAFADTVVPLAPFKNVELRGGGYVLLRHGATQRVTLLKGGTEFTYIRVEGNGTLVIDACEQRCPEHYDLRIEIALPDVDGVAIAGGGAIHADDSFPAGGHFDAAVDGGGDIDLRAIRAADVNAAVDGGGDIKVTATHALTAAISGGGVITYWGNPTVSQAVTGGGTIQPAGR